MKRIIILALILVFAGSNSYAFWIWSPKKDKWLDSAVSYTGPASQLHDALRYFNNRKYKRAIKELIKLIKRFPDSKEAAEAQYSLAESFEKINQPYRAFLEYNKLITAYPNSNRIQNAVADEFRIGKDFIGWKEKRILGIPLSLLEDHPSVEIFNKIVKTSPYSEYAPKALYELGIFLVNHSRNDEAKGAFRKLIDNYPDSGLVVKARYKLALAISNSTPGTDYDQSGIKEAYSRLGEISSDKHAKDSREAKNASKEMKSIKEKGAKKNFDVASFYEKQNKLKSALIYYNIVINKYADTSLAKIARRRVETLKEVLK